MNPRLVVPLVAALLFAGFAALMAVSSVSAYLPGPGAGGTFGVSTDCGSVLNQADHARDGLAAAECTDALRPRMIAAGFGIVGLVGMLLLAYNANDRQAMEQ